MEGLPSEEELSNISNMFSEESGGLVVEEEPQSEPESAETSKEKPKKEKKNGFLQKLMSLFSGKNKDKQKEQEGMEDAALAEGAQDYGDISDENLEILKELSGAGQPDKSSEKKDKKKKKKEETQGVQMSLFDLL